jgi:NTP pyrophosphatase (non-canonical NTP hydrolase)|tara:strand:- start:240 stop:437 length:198 start_codon:yes stop_codon:yes gene_type:complete
MKMIKRLNEIEDETKRIRAVLKQNPSSDELDILNAVLDVLVEETLEITQSIQANDLEMLSDMPRK